MVTVAMTNDRVFINFSTSRRRAFKFILIHSHRFAVTQRTFKCEGAYIREFGTRREAWPVFHGGIEINKSATVSGFASELLRSGIGELL
jgi:hypothetical protein